MITSTLRKRSFENISMILPQASRSPGVTVQNVESHSDDETSSEFDSDTASETSGSDTSILQSPDCKKQRLRSQSSEIIGAPALKSATLFDLPDPEGPEDLNEFLRKLIKAQSGLEIDYKSSVGLSGFKHKVTEEEIAAYTNEVLNAARSNDVSELKRLKENGQSLNCFNRFGESLLHLACRRGFTDIVKMLLDEPEISVRIVDDCGRNPLHDTCWNPTPQLEVFKLVLEREPRLLFLLDRRNFTPFAYARREHYTVWKQFLLDNRKCFLTLESEGFFSETPAAMKTVG